ncbi:potential E3 ubiquitin-protein ligase ariadne-2 [Eurytemora carolleeae]|uniref:potential E3 ubiquitin-protein ligase ariadne-2 n=1 Tax=Eurytemora carolleeae TaxID=1294199 RepID=UPI000C78DFD3|nr:potential E3 ubiquitin-protein ligase ariadne-2 [Eurytemora carolleeae]|eukprot:XP_023322764.1 potential E3 ubiquitin-protein ligase ariadne-2-like [Eurytemora affinis]
MSDTGESSGGGSDQQLEDQDWTGSEDGSEDGGYAEYYSFNDDEEGRASQFNNNDDPEYFSYECLTVLNVEKIFNESIERVKSTLGVSHARAKQILHTCKWNIPEIISKYSPARTSLSPSTSTSTSSTQIYCGVCASTLIDTDFASPKECGHKFCKFCWQMHFEIQINQGVSTTMSCMSPGCDILVDEDLVLSNMSKPGLAERYKHLSFLDYVRCHPNLRFCPGPNCPIVIKAAECVSKNTVCTFCKSRFCFKCGYSYHAPTDCETIKRWLTKCADDSETANYISANTKDCPKCNICIEKNGGCNHMQCSHCKHEFCWMCMGDWRTHGSEYYECSRYKDNPNIAHESAHAQAREALKKYLHYFERWENHSRSMKLEAVTLDKIKNIITEKVMSSCGTWIDWQYLIDAASLLAKCRYTLQYTYPYAYYMDPSSSKELFEYQQAQLEAEIENLSWKIEHAETTDRGDLENQMDIAEKRRTSLLKDFLKT